MQELHCRDCFKLGITVASSMWKAGAAGNWLQYAADLFILRSAMAWRELQYPPDYLVPTNICWHKDCCLRSSFKQRHMTTQPFNVNLYSEKMAIFNLPSAQMNGLNVACITSAPFLPRNIKSFCQFVNCISGSFAEFKIVWQGHMKRRAVAEMRQGLHKKRQNGRHGGRGVATFYCA